MGTLLTTASQPILRTLPPEILTEILQQVPPRKLYSLRRVSKPFKSLAETILLLNLRIASSPDHTSRSNSFSKVTAASPVSVWSPLKQVVMLTPRRMIDLYPTVSIAFRPMQLQQQSASIEAMRKMQAFPLTCCSFNVESVFEFNHSPGRVVATVDGPPIWIIVYKSTVETDETLGSLCWSPSHSAGTRMVVSVANGILVDLRLCDNTAEFAGIRIHPSRLFPGVF